MLQEIVDNDDSIGGFLDVIYKDTVGYSYLATKVPGQQRQFQQHFFEWPKQRSEVVSFVVNHRQTHEVYFSPALFRDSNSSLKENVLGANVVWCEFDGNVPEEVKDLPNPTIRVRSSEEKHEHWYWCLPELLKPNELEHINRSITHFLQADSSGWDCNQILRPIGTVNHKRERPVTLSYYDAQVYLPEAFSHLPQPPPKVDAPVPSEIPAVEDVIAKYGERFFDKAWKVFKTNNPPVGKRSEWMMSLGYDFAEAQLPDVAIFSLLLNVDERWGKFSGRSDQYVRLMEIVVRARVKYPLLQGQENGQSESYHSLGLKSLLETEISLEWVWEGFLQEDGYFLLTGHSGVGKTQFSLIAAMHFALGRDFLGTKVTKKYKIGFFSLEMGLPDLKHFLSTMVSNFSPEDLDVLEQNLRIFPLGEPIYLNRDEEKRKIEAVIEREKLDGVFVDSLGSTTEEELTHEKDVKNLMDWNDRLRQRFHVFTWFIHHHRKATGDNKKPNKLADVYGSQYITARATTVVCLWGTAVKNAIEVLCLKLRLHEHFSTFAIHRTSQLNFEQKADLKAIAAESPILLDTSDIGETEEPPPSPGIGTSDI